MEQIPTIVHRLPHRELEIRRCWARDTRFRAICTDHEEASRALAHWRTATSEGNGNGQRNVEEYTRLLNELEEEIVTFLDRSMPRPEQAEVSSFHR